MPISGENVLLRFYLRSGDRAPFSPTHERILKAARREGLAGATVFTGIMGFHGRDPVEARAWTLVEHLPVIVEIVDDGRRIADFISGPLSGKISGGYATLERAAVLMYRHDAPEPASFEQMAAAIKPLSTLPKIEPRDDMKINDDGVLLRVFIGESDRHEHKPLYEAIVRQARQLGIAGATVLRGVEGFGANSVVHRAGILAMSTDLPIVVEIVDTAPNIQRLLPTLEGMVKEGMITMEYVVILMYRHNGAAAVPDSAGA